MGSSVELTGKAPRVAGRVVNLRKPHKSLCGTSGNKNLTAGQQCCRVTSPRVPEIGGRHPRAGGRIVNFRGGGRAAPGCDKNPAIWEQRRRMQIPSSIQAASEAPRAAGRIIKFRACESDSVKAAYDKNLSIEQ